MADPIDMAETSDNRMDEIMGRLLRTGVILAAVVVLIGGVKYLAEQPGPVSDYRVFHGEPDDLRNISGILHGTVTLDGRALIQFGLLILIGTPISRVVFSVVAFLYQRDWTYVVVTLTVLGLLVYSLLGGGS